MTEEVHHRIACTNISEHSISPPSGVPDETVGEVVTEWSQGIRPIGIGRERDDSGIVDDLVSRSIDGLARRGTAECAQVDELVVMVLWPVSLCGTVLRGQSNRHRGRSE